VGRFQTVKACLGITEPVPFPNVIIYEGEWVECAGKVKEGCFTAGDPGTVHLPDTQVTERTIDEEFLHYFLFATTGNLDPKHLSEKFLTCEGIILE